MNLNNKLDREDILNLLESMQYYLDGIFALQSQIQCCIHELRDKQINFKEDVNFQKMKLILRESKENLKKYKTITKETKFDFLLSQHSKEKVIISLLKKHNYDRQKMIRANRQWVGNLLTCYYRLSRLSNAPEHIEKLSREIKKKIIQEFILYDRYIQEEKTRIRKAEKAILFMNILGEIEQESHHDYLNSVTKLKELNERIEQIFITKHSKVFVVKNRRNNLTLVS